MSSATPRDRRLLPVSDAVDQDWSESEREVPHPSARFLWLDWLNRLLAFLLLLPGLPMIMALAAITRLSSKGPALYRQTRVGLQGQPFSLCKIRTMSHDAEAATGPVWSPAGADPRVTKVGRFLRKSHFDELPQLFNVLVGDMVLIGPRPERPEFTQFLAQEVPGYVDRLVVKPGITGLAQINLQPDSDLDSVRKKLALDMEYINDSSFWMDVRILMCTALKTLGLDGATLARYFGLRRRPSLDVCKPAVMPEQPAAAAVNAGGPPPVELGNGHPQSRTSVITPRSAGDAAVELNGNGLGGVERPIVFSANGEEGSQPLVDMNAVDRNAVDTNAVHLNGNGHVDPQRRTRRQVRPT